MWYIEHLNSHSDNKTLKRKQGYIKYNFGKYIPEAKDLKLLEIWPWLGEFVSYLKNRWIDDITIVDNDQSILDYNIQKFHIKKVFLLENSIKELENKLETYDIIFLTQVLEHVPIDLQKELISSLYSLLNHNWKIIITVPNWNNFLSITERYWDITHTCMFTPTSLIQLCQFCWIKGNNIHINGYNIPPYSAVNLFRIFFQKILHAIILLIYVTNGWIFSTILTPNISLIITKD